MQKGKGPQLEEIAGMMKNVFVPRRTSVRPYNW